MRTFSLAIALVLVACADDPHPSIDVDGSAETAPETAPDAIADAPDTNTPDAIPDTAPDATADTLADALADTAPDALADAIPDTAPDALADATPDTAPVIDPNGDTDHDGVFDLAELDDGTDPFDPRSARAWHPEIKGHPRLFVRPEDQPAIALRTQLDGPTATLWARVLALAARPMPEHPSDAPFDTSIPPNQAQIAEAAALVGFATGDLAMTTKALAVLAAPFPDPTPLNQRSMFNAGDHYDLLEAEALQGFCSAYDLAAGTADADPTLLAAAAARLTERVDYFRTLCMSRGGCTSLLRGEPNNHAIKALAALGTCAMALPDRATAAADFNEALTAITHLAHDRQGNAEGGWAESWNYLSYSGETHLGFLAAIHHVALAPWSLVGEGWLTRNNPANRTRVTVPDPAADPIWRAVYERALFATMPWGTTPTVDDANPSALHGGLLAALFGDPRFLWNWQLPRVGLHTGRQLVATFLMLDPAMSPETPTWTDGSFADAGFSVLRRSLDPLAPYFHMQHEPAPMRTNGGAHEHADPLSFILSAYGTELAIDPGYIDFTNHIKVKFGKDHNIILVDGAGPEFFLDGIVFEAAPNSDAFLHEHAATGPFTTLIASTKYAGAELRRRVVRVASAATEVFVIADRLIDAAAATRSWTFQLNGLASEELANTSFATTDTANGTVAVWQRPAASLFAAVSAPVLATIGSRLEESAFASQHHRCLTVDAAMGANAGFLSVLVPALPAVVPAFATRVVGDVVITTLTLTDITVTSYLNSGLATNLDGRTLEPGLTIIANDGAEHVAHWTMQTPPIPDPTPFIPLP